MATIVYPANQRGPVDHPAPHDPDALLDYGFNYNDAVNGPYLETGETILTSTWVATAGVTLGAAGYVSTSDATTTKVWVVGITDATLTEFELTNHIITSNTPAREDDRSVRVQISER